MRMRSITPGSSRGPGWSFERLDELEGRLCMPCNQFSRYRCVGAYFRLVSRLGDGILWYALLALLPLWFGYDAFKPTAHVAFTALAGVVLYKVIKGCMMRERPFASHANLHAVTPPLDRYSFPSGHTLQATLFLVMLNHYFPGVALLLLPFGVSVAASRVILGLHYPSDVVVGAMLGYALALGSLMLLQP
jgi:undecaprenyl-diphosphatase